ncbi:hypothetical protein ACJ41O_011228 [Fusarium nematophilum]
MDPLAITYRSSDKESVSEKQPVPADSLVHNQTTAEEAMRLEDAESNAFRLHYPQYFDSLKERRTGCRFARRKHGKSSSTSTTLANVAKRVAEELDVNLGEQVGYTVRFQNVSSDETRLKFLTDGLLLQQLKTDMVLSDYACIIVDEAHERTANTDLLLALLKRAP